VPKDTTAVMFQIIQSHLTFSITHMYHSYSCKYIPLRWNYFLPQYITPAFIYQISDAKRTPPAPLHTETIQIISRLKKMYFPLPVPRPAFWWIVYFRFYHLTVRNTVPRYLSLLHPKLNTPTYYQSTNASSRSVRPTLLYAMNFPAYQIDLGTNWLRKSPWIYHVMRTERDGSKTCEHKYTECIYSSPCLRFIFQLPKSSHLPSSILYAILG
jgi:hypothetical protein